MWNIWISKQSFQQLVEYKKTKEYKNFQSSSDFKVVGIFEVKDDKNKIHEQLKRDLNIYDQNCQKISLKEAIILPAPASTAALYGGKYSLYMRILLMSTVL